MLVEIDDRQVIESADFTLADNWDGGAMSWRSSLVTPATHGWRPR
jgi:hypothetical protein